MTTKLLGEKVQRVEDERLLRGKGQYTDDLMPGALEVAVLRSPHAHARIRDIDVDAVLDVEADERRAHPVSSSAGTSSPGTSSGEQ